MPDFEVGDFVEELPLSEQIHPRRRQLLSLVTSDRRTFLDQPGPIFEVCHTYSGNHEQIRLSGFSRDFSSYRFRLVKHPNNKEFSKFKRFQESISDV